MVKAGRVASNWNSHAADNTAKDYIHDVVDVDGKCENERSTILGCDDVLEHTHTFYRICVCVIP